MIVSEFFAYIMVLRMWLEICDNFHTANARSLAYGGLHILAWEFVDVLNYWVVPSSGSHKQFAHFLSWFWLVKGYFGYKTWHFLVHPFLQLLQSKVQRVIHVHFFPQKSSFPMNQACMLSHSNLQTNHEMPTTNMEWIS